ncbi:hypothetical protein GMA92_12650 [Turicibacter sanguinis]|uniref:Uncharacterized protein n=1 Tax=Turicibacter sanguinis TaxID=154288 RepID=A0A9X5AQ20_9FIRM|nr:hypothetical protein [Turicibacter sanguinis]KAB6698720.1 hypothetical protein GAZ90_21795 [Phocaeicola vulgatus]MCU7195517.1 hypothetical protein [Turicibacter sanguinis]MDB8574032.1 hypothetical protein [Turicibacter sanguinis]MDB8576781.1 hypothetical protein [Turicibacter sanguinis]MDB8582811.1 hypothetical protein [Turicibacter sanguinis]
MGVMDIHTSMDKVVIFGILFVKESNTVQIRPHGSLKEIVRLNIQSIGELQRFAVEWYYKNIYHQNFGGREMAPYEVVLKNY